MIEKLKLVDEDSEYPYIDDKGVSHKTKSDYLQQNYLDSCGCGNPDQVMIYLKGYLDEIDKKEWKRGYEDLPYMFFCYWADRKGYIEHGTTVRCSWLTNKGKELLADINWCIENEVNKE